MGLTLRTIFAAIFIMAGALLLLWQPIVNQLIAPVMMEKAHEEVFALSYQDYRENREAIELQEGMFDYESVSSLSSLSTSIDINHKNAIGEILIPSVDVHLPILIGTNNDTLKAGIGTMKPGQQMGEGNYALAGHNSRNPNQLFAPIRNMELGNTILITDKSQIYVYRMSSKEIVLPHRIDVIEDIDNQSIVTLVSCYSDDGSDRIIIQGELVDVVLYETLSEIVDEEK